ncbi:MAG TPA: DUF763 domain-containing protein [Candidatus Thermoplasmatota archaeon]|nr:DUF763 domain-containing protein [Candidatus Thermoplasmatota archaeon]
MPKTGVASLPLHPGKAPRWLFKRMVSLSRGITEVILTEYGPDEFLRRLSDPFWFQALSCVLGYDWHSSGTTTVTCGALKEAMNAEDLGISFCGGKGKASRNTLSEITTVGDKYHLSSSAVERLQYCSRMAAKVDNTAIQDGHTLYHHVFVVTENKRWAVIQQGMNSKTSYARRYHWLSEDVDSFVREPHNAIVGDDRQETVLDMTAKQSQQTQRVSLDLVNDHPQHLRRDWAELTRHENQETLDSWVSPGSNKNPMPRLAMPPTINWQRMKEIYDVHPTNYEELLSLQGVGPNTVRALALISELLYGEQPSWEDPVRFSFSVGGKDGVPYPVDRKAMDESTEVIRTSIEHAKIGDKERLQALRRLREFLPPVSS